MSGYVLQRLIGKFDRQSGFSEFNFFFLMEWIGGLLGSQPATSRRNRITLDKNLLSKLADDDVLYESISRPTFWEADAYESKRAHDEDLKSSHEIIEIVCTLRFLDKLAFKKKHSVALTVIIALEGFRSRKGDTEKAIQHIRTDTMSDFLDTVWKLMTQSNVLRHALHAFLLSSALILFELND